MNETTNRLADIDCIAALLARHPTIENDPELTAAIALIQKQIADLQTDIED